MTPTHVVRFDTLHWSSFTLLRIKCYKVEAEYLREFEFDISYTQLLLSSHENNLELYFDRFGYCSFIHFNRTSGKSEFIVCDRMLHFQLIISIGN